MKNPNHRFSVDDTLFVMALAIPAIVAAASYVDSEREISAIAKSQEARTIAVARSVTSELEGMSGVVDSQPNRAVASAASVNEHTPHAPKDPR